MSTKTFRSEVQRIGSQRHALSAPLPVKLLERLPFSIKAESLIGSLRRLLESAPTNVWDVEFAKVKLGIDEIILVIDKNEEYRSCKGKLIRLKDWSTPKYDLSGFANGCELLTKHYSKFLAEYRRHGFVRPGIFRNHDEGLRRAANNFKAFSSAAVAQLFQVSAYEGEKVLELARMSRLQGGSEELEQAIECGLVELLQRLEVSQAEHCRMLETAFAMEVSNRWRAAEVKTARVDSCLPWPRGKWTMRFKDANVRHTDHKGSAGIAWDLGEVHDASEAWMRDEGFDQDRTQAVLQKLKMLAAHED